MSGQRLRVSLGRKPPTAMPSFASSGDCLRCKRCFENAEMWRCGHPDAAMRRNVEASMCRCGGLCCRFACRFAGRPTSPILPVLSSSTLCRSGLGDGGDKSCRGMPGFAGRLLCCRRSVCPCCQSAFQLVCCQMERAGNGKRQNNTWKERAGNSKAEKEGAGGGGKRRGMSARQDRLASGLHYRLGGW